MRNPLRNAILALAFLAAPAVHAAGGGLPGEWQKWQPGNEINNIASLQRGAGHFMGYCAGCHSLKYVRYSRLAADLKIPEAQLESTLLPPGAKKGDYVITALAAADGEAWFGKTPPDLSLITRAKGSDHVYRFLKTFYVDDKTVNGTNNLALPGTAMPHVLSALQGAQALKTVKKDGHEHFEGFEQLEPGQLTAAQYDEFVRDTVNFLEYAGEPAKAKRMSLGVWVILFLLMFTAFAYLLKKEYWRDVK
ncbi:MAG: cytochrome c1 [Gammaproteobacteria bacterium]|nr:cytochrome c1 [Gammaproteobacteria bacterium]